MNIRFAGVGAALAGAFAASPALGADVGGDGFLSGLLHPILGFDHLLAMVAVGLLSVQLGGRAVWTVPAAFVALLAFGGGLGLAEIGLPQVEGAIALSVLALGLAIAMTASMPMIVAMLFVGFFAIFHGHAHGQEIPNLAEPWKYVIGFMLASAALHLAGVAIGFIARSEGFRSHLGAGVAGVGAYMLLLTYNIA